MFCGPVLNVPDGVACGGAAACQVGGSPSSRYSNSLGKFSTVQWFDIENGVMMTATGGTESLGIARSLKVSIVCPSVMLSDPYPKLVDLSDDKQYTFTWNHLAACKISDGGDSAGIDGGLDNGWIMIIIIVVLLVAYCGGGALFLYFVKGCAGAARSLVFVVCSTPSPTSALAVSSSFRTARSGSNCRRSSKTGARRCLAKKCALAHHRTPACARDIADANSRCPKSLVAKEFNKSEAVFTLFAATRRTNCRRRNTTSQCALRRALSREPHVVRPGDTRAQRDTHRRTTPRARPSCFRDKRQ